MDRLDLIEYGWYSRNSGKETLLEGTALDPDKVIGEWGCRTHSVGQKKPNDFGLYDMHGNLWELCEDVFDAEFYSKPEASRRDPICTSGSGFQVARGGCWNTNANICRSAFRGRFRLSPRTRRSLNYGLRASFPLP